MGVKGKYLAAWLGLLLGAVPAGAACKLSKVVDLPVTLRGMQPLTQASINGHPVQLLVDSGMFYSLLPPSTASQFNLPLEPAPRNFFLSGAGGTVQTSIGTVHDFTVSGVTLHHLEFLVGGSETGSYGVIGQNILHFRDVEYDLGSGMVRLMSAQDCGHTNLAYWAKPNQAVAMLALQNASETAGWSRHTVGTIQVNGVAIKALFDTGASASAIYQPAAVRAGVRVIDPGVTPTGFSHGIGRHLVRQWIATFKSVDIGGEQINNTRLRILEGDGDGIDMLVGADFFLSHHVYVANNLHRMFLTYNGGQVFRLRDIQDEPAGPVATAVAANAGTAAAETAPSVADPTDADGFARRGAAKLARREPEAALSDLNEAVRRAPDRADFVLERARIHMTLRQPLLAGADLDAALRLKPDEVEAHLMRSALRLRANDRDGARDDADAVARLAARPADLRLDLGGLYDELDLFDQAIEQDTIWIAAHPDDARRATALNGRCWARALANKDLPQALADCDGAVRRQAGNASFLDSRGLVHLRMRDYDKAIADYDKALAIEPRLAFSLYGRGLAKLGKGDAAGGKADLAAATAISAEVPRRARRYGLVPPA